MSSSWSQSEILEWEQVELEVVNADPDEVTDESDDGNSPESEDRPESFRLKHSRFWINEFFALMLVLLMAPSDTTVVE